MSHDRDTRTHRPTTGPPDDGVRQLARLLRGHRLEAQGGAVAEALRHYVHNGSPHAGWATRLHIRNIFLNQNPLQ